MPYWPPVHLRRASDVQRPCRMLPMNPDVQVAIKFIPRGPSTITKHVEREIINHSNFCHPHVVQACLRLQTDACCSGLARLTLATAVQGGIPHSTASGHCHGAHTACDCSCQLVCVLSLLARRSLRLAAICSTL